MKLRKMKPHSLTYLFSVLLGLLLLMIVLVAFLRFSNGSFGLALLMAFSSTLLLSLFLGWVDIEEVRKEKDEENKYKKIFGRRI